MYTYHRTKKKKNKRLFFLLFIALIAVIPILAFNSGQNHPAISLTYPQTEVFPVLHSYQRDGATVLKLHAPTNESDSWRLRDGQLELTLKEPFMSTMPPNSIWLDQNVQVRQDTEGTIVSFTMDNLPPLFTVWRNANGYTIEWVQAGIEGKRIAIDPGHGGHDPGAVGRVLKLEEKNITLAIALELRDLLTQAGAEVFMTRETDTLVDTTVKIGQHIRNDLWMRRDIVNEWEPDFFISIHNNSWSDSVTGGIETYYNRHSLNYIHSRVAAQKIQARLVDELGRRDRGVKYKQSSDAVLQVDFPAVLAEILFISSIVEERILAEPNFPERAARALFLGIEDYFNSFGGDDN